METSVLNALAAIMQVEMEASVFALDDIVSDADFVLFSPWHGLLSEHCTYGEARMAKYKEASKVHLGEQLPLIYQRQDEAWVPVH